MTKQVDLAAMSGQKFNGSADRVELPIAPFQTISNAVTIEFWAKVNTGISSCTTFLMAYDTEGREHALFISLPWDSKIHWDTGTAWTSTDRLVVGITDAVLPRSQWVHWAFTHDAGAGIKCIYRNGELFQHNNSARPLQPLARVDLGGDEGSSGWYGELALLRVWNLSRSAADIKANMGAVIDNAPGLAYASFVPANLHDGPQANAGHDRDATVGALVHLDGSGSLSPDGEALTYAWSLSKPAGSTATLDDPAKVNPSFTADLAGVYTAQLTVRDQVQATALATVGITAKVVSNDPNQLGLDYSPTGGSLREYVTLKNEGSGPVQLEGMQLRIPSAAPKIIAEGKNVFTFPSLVLAPNDMVSVYGLGHTYNFGSELPMLYEQGKDKVELVVGGNVIKSKSKS